MKTPAPATEASDAAVGKAYREMLRANPGLLYPSKQDAIALRAREIDSAPAAAVGGDPADHDGGSMFDPPAGCFVLSEKDNEWWWQRTDHMNPEARNMVRELLRTMGNTPTAQPSAKDGVRVPAHFDDESVDRFAAAMKDKLAKARAAGRHGWNDTSDPDMHQHLSDLLREHVEKGDPRDVANFCMFLHQRGESIAPAQLLDSDQIGKLQAFKDYVHLRLDAAGIPTHPEGQHSAHGCRIGDRLDFALATSAAKGGYSISVGVVRQSCRDRQIWVTGHYAVLTRPDLVREGDEIYLHPPTDSGTPALWWNGETHEGVAIGPTVSTRKSQWHSIPLYRHADSGAGRDGGGPGLNPAPPTIKPTPYDHSQDEQGPCLWPNCACDQPSKGCGK